MTDADVQNKEELVGVIWTRKDEIRTHILAKTVSLSTAKLKDFDWQMKVLTLIYDLIVNHKAQLAISFYSVSMQARSPGSRIK